MKKNKSSPPRGGGGSPRGLPAKEGTSPLRSLGLTEPHQMEHRQMLMDILGGDGNTAPGIDPFVDGAGTSNSGVVPFEVNAWHSSSNAASPIEVEQDTATNYHFPNRGAPNNNTSPTSAGAVAIISPSGHPDPTSSVASNKGKIVSKPNAVHDLWAHQGQSPRGEMPTLLASAVALSPRDRQNDTNASTRNPTGGTRRYRTRSERHGTPPDATKDVVDVVASGRRQGEDHTGSHEEEEAVRDDVFRIFQGVGQGQDSHLSSSRAPPLRDNELPRRENLNLATDPAARADAGSAATAQGHPAQVASGYKHSAAGPNHGKAQPTPDVGRGGHHHHNKNYLLYESPQHSPRIPRGATSNAPRGGWPMQSSPSLKVAVPALFSFDYDRAGALDDQYQQQLHVAGSGTRAVGQQHCSSSTLKGVRVVIKSKDPRRILFPPGSGTKALRMREEDSTGGSKNEEDHDLVVPGMTDAGFEQSSSSKDKGEGRGVALTVEGTQDQATPLPAGEQTTGGLEHEQHHKKELHLSTNSNSMSSDFSARTPRGGRSGRTCFVLPIFSRFTFATSGQVNPLLVSRIVEAGGVVFTSPQEAEAEAQLGDGAPTSSSTTSATTGRKSETFLTTPRGIKQREFAAQGQELHLTSTSSCPRSPSSKTKTHHHLLLHHHNGLTSPIARLPVGIPALPNKTTTGSVLNSSCDLHHMHTGASASSGSMKSTPRGATTKHAFSGAASAANFSTQAVSSGAALYAAPSPRGPQPPLAPTLSKPMSRVASEQEDFHCDHDTSERRVTHVLLGYDWSTEDVRGYLKITSKRDKPHPQMVTPAFAEMCLQRRVLVDEAPYRVLSAADLEQLVLAQVDGANEVLQKGAVVETPRKSPAATGHLSGKGVNLRSIQQPHGPGASQLHRKIDQALLHGLVFGCLGSWTADHPLLQDIRSHGGQTRLLGGGSNGAPATPRKSTSHGVTHFLVDSHKAKSQTNAHRAGSEDDSRQIVDIAWVAACLRNHVLMPISSARNNGNKSTSPSKVGPGAVGKKVPPSTGACRALLRSKLVH
ncbi:unnamed protein product [Amoebophrya sp. A25]|nr:unnamed protein product [Amoebophrya sp. A25]|eukprot:GSA25T00012448001.1